MILVVARLGCRESLFDGETIPQNGDPHDVSFLLFKRSFLCWNSMESCQLPSVRFWQLWLRFNATAKLKNLFFYSVLILFSASRPSRDVLYFS